MLLAFRIIIFLILIPISTYAQWKIKRVGVELLNVGTASSNIYKFNRLLPDNVGFLDSDMASAKISFSFEDSLGSKSITPFAHFYNSNSEINKPLSSRLTGYTIGVIGKYALINRSKIKIWTYIGWGYNQATLNIIAKDSVWTWNKITTTPTFGNVSLRSELTHILNIPFGLHFIYKSNFLRKKSPEFINWGLDIGYMYQKTLDKWAVNGASRVVFGVPEMDLSHFFVRLSMQFMINL